MSIEQVQDAVSSIEFAEWMAFYRVEAELFGATEREPTPEELGDKLTAWATLHNAREHGKLTRERR